MQPDPGYGAAPGTNRGGRSDHQGDDDHHDHTASPTREMYRVRWWRPGWRWGRQAANVRYFARRHDAEAFVAKLTALDATPAGRICVELHSCWATRWVEVDR